LANQRCFDRSWLGEQENNLFCSKVVKNFLFKVIQLRDGSFEGDKVKHAISEMLILRRKLFNSSMILHWKNHHVTGLLD